MIPLHDKLNVHFFQVSTLESLKDKTDAEIHRMVVAGGMGGGGATPGGDVVVTPSLLQQQDLRRLTRAIQHLRKYTDVLLHSLQPDPKLELYWDSWTREEDQQVDSLKHYIYYLCLFDKKTFLWKKNPHWFSDIKENSTYWG